MKILNIEIAIPFQCRAYHLLGVFSILLLTGCHGNSPGNVMADSSNNTGPAQPVLEQQTISRKEIKTETNELFNEKIPGPTSEALLAQMQPPSSCKSALENLKFAMEQKLFLHEDFYTESNVKKLLGDYYKIRFPADFSKTFGAKNNIKNSYLDAMPPTSDNPMDTLGTEDLSAMPCIASARFNYSAIQHDYENAQRYNSISIGINIGIGSTRSGKRKVTIKQLEAIFGRPDKVVPDLGDRHPKLPNGEIAKIEKGLKAAFYRFQNGNYLYSMHATINKAGDVYFIRIETSNRP